MGRRKRSSGAEDFIDVVAMMPPWAGVLLAVASYFALRYFASQPAPPTGAVQPGQMSGLVIRTMSSTLASIGQYLVPVFCLLGAFGSFIGRRRRARLLEGVKTSTSAAPLNDMSWREFEMLVGESFREQGYGVVETGGGGSDGGVDLIVRKDGKSYLVQCKQWKAFTVPVTVVRELFGLMQHHGAAGAFVVASGQFTRDARAFAEGKNIRLVDGAELLRRVKRAEPRISQPASVAQPAAPALATPPVVEAPACPVCHARMVLRTAKQGARVGTQFWGCSQYPACKGTRQLA